MPNILEWINLDEFVPLVILIVLLFSVGRQMTPPHTQTHRWARRMAAAGFVLYAATGLYVWPPEEVVQVVVIVIRAMLAGALVEAISTIILPALEFVYRHLPPLPDPPIRMPSEPEQNEVTPEMVLPPLPPEPPPVSRTVRMRQLVESAEADFQAEVAMLDGLSLDDDERDVLRLQAKQRLLQKLSDAAAQ